MKAELVYRALLKRAFLEGGFPERRDTLLDFARLYDLSRARTAEYRSAEPFPHVVIDDFLPQESLDAVIRALPSVDDPAIRWGNLTTHLPDGRPAQVNKYHLPNVLYMQPVVRQLLAELNSGPFTLLLSELTGIADLIADPQLQGGGVHIVRRGGVLRVHADFRRHPAFLLERRLNVLLYLNPGWREEYGGHLELWSRDMKTCERRLLPIANRCVVFNTSADSFHGHPHPLTCPEDTPRRSIALYYYTAERPRLVEPDYHATLWQDLPDEGADENGS